MTSIFFALVTDQGMEDKCARYFNLFYIVRLKKRAQMWLESIGVTITHFVRSQKNEMLLKIAEDLPNIETDKLKVKLACGQRKLKPS
jgi:hypothetical protein